MNALLAIFFIAYLAYCLLNNIRFIIIYILLVVIYHFVFYVKLWKTDYDRGRRKMLVGSWNTPYDPQTFVKLKLDITKTEKFLEEFSNENVEKITLTIFMIRVMAMVLKKFPEIDVAVGDGEDLVNTTMRNVDKLSLIEIGQSLKKTAAIIREKKLKTHNDKMNVVKLFPTFLLGPIMQMVSYLSSAGVGVDVLGMPKHEFGSCVITSIGSIGIDDAFAPIPPLTFAPMLLVLCKKKTKYYKDDNNKVNEKSVMNINFTIDQRYIDSDSIQRLFGEVKRIGENPDVFKEELKKQLEEGQRQTTNSNDKKIV